MPHTARQHVEQLTGRTFTDAEADRLMWLIPIAEDELTLAAGQDWYDADTPDGTASRQWLEATALLAVAMLDAQSADYRAALGPVKSVSIKGYSATFRDAAELAAPLLSRLPRVQQLIARYRVVAVATFAGFALAGPASRTPVLIEGAEVEDVSRRCC